MANERLRAGLSDAGLDTEQLAGLVGVQRETVARWLAGRVPYARHRIAVAKALGRPEHDLWPEASRDRTADEVSQEILSAWGRVDDGLPGDWSALLGQASARIDLVGCRLDQILRTPGTLERLVEKATAGCRVRVVLPAADSRWLTEAAHRSGRGEADYVGRTELHRQVELTIGHLQPLLDHPNVDARATYDELSISALRFEQDMLVELMLAGADARQGPVLHLRRHIENGLFDELAAHLDALHGRGVRLDPDPDLYPDPGQIPQRYQPVTERIYRGQLAALEQELGNAGQLSPPATRRPGKLRRRPQQR